MKFFKFRPKEKPAEKPVSRPVLNERKKFKKEVSTMQDDIGNLMTGKKDGQPAIDKEMRRHLAQVYTDGDGHIPDLTKLEKTAQPVWKKVLYWLIAILALLLVVGASGLWFFLSWESQRSFTNESVIVKIEPPLTLVSGQEAVYLVKIINQEKINLYNAQLQLTYPDNFLYVSGQPVGTGDQNNLWDFSVLKVGETQEIVFKGKVTAALGSIQTFKGVLTFKPANLNAVFKQEAVVDVAVSSSLVSLTVVGPESTLANQENEYEIKYKNIGQEALSDLQLVVDYPAGFVLAETEPESSEKGTDNVWLIPELAPAAEGAVKIKGDFSALAETGNQEIKARMLMKYQGDYYPQSEEIGAVKVIKDQLSLQLVINGSAEDQPINFGDLLVSSLTFKNSGESELKNIKLAAHLNSEILDWGSLVDEKRGARIGDSLVWTGKNIPQLLKLGPGEEGSVTWQIRAENADTIGEKVSKFSVETYVEGEAEQAGGGKSTVKTKTITNAINTNLGLRAQARYYNEDNVPLGLGPIRPKVGETSTYNIKINLINNLHDATDIRLVAVLPKGAVKYGDKETHNTGDLVYDSGANKVTWLISRLSKSAKETEATFNVSLKPTADDLGRVLILVSEISLIAKDADTGAEISQKLPAITTAFNDPILGQVSGVVE